MCAGKCSYFVKTKSKIYSSTNAFWNPILKFHISDPKHSSVTLICQVHTLRQIHAYIHRKICEIHTSVGLTIFKLTAVRPT